MVAIRGYGMPRSKLRRYRQAGMLPLLLVGLMLASGGALAHGVDYRIERGEAVLVHFSSQHDGPMVGAGFRVFSPDGRRIFSSGNTDALGRAVFVPDQSGEWRVLMATEDGHGAEVEVHVEGGAEAAGPGRDRDSGVPVAGRIPATAAGIGYLFGLAGLLALWRLRR
ncbi:MAG: hypothetical protein CMP07_12310 [Xanthomonadales bacterium]|nr:hypothetical protein [Xanthomonadales bacterium]